MANLLDYLDWRGDLTFAQDEMNDIDNLIFTQLVFFDFSDIVPLPGQGEEIPFGEACAQLFEKERLNRDFGVLISGDNLRRLMDKLANTPRYRDLTLSAFVDHIDYEKKIQFAALSIGMPNGVKYLAFRGTDDTLAGWQEDFNMSFLPSVPSQQEAVAYADLIAESADALILGGHSKGGNLAVYAGANGSPLLRRKLLRIYNNDGPGFSEDMLDAPGYVAIKDKIRTLVPQTSIVGMLFERAEAIHVVLSNQTGVFQHDGFSWQVMGREFVNAGELTKESRLIEKSLKAWIATMDAKQREAFVTAFFDVMSATDAKTLSELSADKIRFLRVLATLKPETRGTLVSNFRELIAEGAKNLQEELAERPRRQPRKKAAPKKEAAPKETAKISVEIRPRKAPRKPAKNPNEGTPESEK